MVRTHYDAPGTFVDNRHVRCRDVCTACAASWDKPALSVTKLNGNTLGKTVRTDRWRYAEWGDDGKEGAMLIDEQNDLHELKNVAADPANAEVVKELKALLQSLTP